MTRIQQVLFEVETPYCGHPYFVTGHALFNSIARRVDADTARTLCVSTGVFVPGEYGSLPESCSNSGYAGKVGTSLPDVETYADLFVFRDPAMRWLLDSRPRDAHNVLDVQTHGGRQVFADKCWVGKPAAQRNNRRSVQWYVHAYLHTGRGAEDVLPLAEDVLDGVRVGGARNYGFGELAVLDTQVVELDELSFARLTDCDAVQLEVVSPYVLASEYPGADDQSVPWWWNTGDRGVRRRRSRLVVGDDTYELTVVDHGQVVRYAGKDAITTAKNGVLRVGTHAKYGFGELRVRPADTDRVPERAEAVAGGDA